MIQRTVSTTVQFLSASSTSEILWQPGADIYHSPHGWLVKLDLAGVPRMTLPSKFAGNGLQSAAAGLTPEQFTISDEALRNVIARYTREADLRQLERAIGSLARKAALRFAEGKTAPCSKIPACSFTFPPEPFPKTVLRQASQWRQR